MKENSDSKSSLPIVESYFVKEIENFIETQDWKHFVTSYKRINKASHNSAYPFDPRFNAVSWAFNVNSLCKEIVYGYCWMKAHAKYYRENVPRNSQPTHADFNVVILCR